MDKHLYSFSFSALLFFLPRVWGRDSSGEPEGVLGDCGMQGIGRVLEGFGVFGDFFGVFGGFWGFGGGYGVSSSRIIMYFMIPVFLPFSLT